LQSDGISVPYHLLREYGYASSGEGHFRYHDWYFSRGETKVIFDAYQELPALEDMNHAFWQEAGKQLEEGQNITAFIQVERNLAGGRDGVTNIVQEKAIARSGQLKKVYVSNPLVIKPRPGSEMQLLENWLDGTPERLMPVPFDQVIAEYNFLDAVHELKDEFDTMTRTPRPDFVSQQRDLKIMLNDRLFLSSKERFIRIKEQEFFPFYFLRHGNRKPGDPVCPETWQGWKELEVNLIPSTMRDEIRLTRIMIQYFDTDDSIVLQELREWFDDMNELQRMSMAKRIYENVNRILSNVRSCNAREYEDFHRSERIARSARFLYRSIRQYDKISDLALALESNAATRDMRELGLFE
jgi:hypothetical protein